MLFVFFFFPFRPILNFPGLPREIKGFHPFSLVGITEDFLNRLICSPTSGHETYVCNLICQSDKYFDTSQLTCFTKFVNI